MENSKQYLEINKLNDTINVVEKQKNRELEELRIQLNSTHNYAIDNIHKTFDNQQNILQSEIRDLQIQLELKDRELGEYIKKYEKLEFDIKDYLNNPNKQRDTSDILTQKNLYDVLIKTRAKSPVKSPYKSPYKSPLNNK